jgi:5-epi-alpha-selinene synthase
MLEWAVELGLVGTSPAEQRRYSQNGLLMGRAYPGASPEALELATDWSGWLCFLDDRCDEGDLKRRPDELRRLHADYLGILEEGARPRADDALGRALYDLRGRMLRCGSRAWLLSFADEVKHYFDANRWEASNRAAGVTPGFMAYRSMRPYTSAVYTCFSLFHITDGLEHSEALGRDRSIQELARLAGLVISYCNDLQSLGKELRHGDVHNAVIVLRNERGLSLEAAAAKVIDLHNQEMRAYLSLEEQVVEQGLSRYPQRRELARCLRSWMRGNLDWGNMTYRYNARDERRRPSVIPPALVAAAV